MNNGSVKFDRAVEYYDATRGFPPEQVQPVIALFSQAGHLMPTSQALEIGIGTGRIAVPLRAHIGALYGLDLSRPMMQRLGEKAAAQASAPIHLVEASATDIPFTDQCFDAVIAVMYST